MATAQRARSEAELKPRIRHELQRARVATLALLESVRDQELARQHFRRSCRRSSGTSPTSASTRSCGCCGAIGGARAARRALRRPLRRVPPPARRAAGAAAARPEPARGVPRRRPRRARSRCSTRSSSTRDDPLLADGFVYGMVVQHEQQHVETMLADAPAAASSRTRRPAARAPVGGAGPAEVLVAGGPFVMGTTDEPLGLRQRAAGARGRAAGRSGSTATRSRTARTSRSSRPAATTSRAGGATTGWAWRGARPARAPAVLAPRGAAAGRGAASAASSRCRPTSRCSTSAGTRPTPTPAGRASGCRPRPSGRRRRGIRAAVRRSLGRRLAGRRPRRAPLGPPSAPTRRAALVRQIGDVWEWTAATSALPRLRVPLPRVLRGLLRRRVQGAARRLVGDAPASSRGPRSATGTTRSAARSSPASAARGTPDGARRSTARRRRPSSTCTLRGRTTSTRRCAPTCLAGLTAHAEGAAAEVVLRRRAARSSSTRSPGCPSTTRPGASARSSLREAAEIARLTGADTLVELGSGTSEKTRLLLDALAARRAAAPLRPVRRERGDAARERRRRSSAEYPGIEVHAVVGDFERHLGLLPDGGRRLVAFLGSTIGNLEPAERGRVPRRARRRRSRRRRVPARHRSGQGPGPARGGLRRRGRRHRRVQPQRAAVLNRELGADFDLERFEHVPLGRRRRSGSRCACARPASRRCTSADARPRGRVRARARRCAPRSAPSSAATGVEAELRGAGFEPAGLDGPRRRLRPLPGTGRFVSRMASLAPAPVRARPCWYHAGLGLQRLR